MLLVGVVLDVEGEVVVTTPHLGIFTGESTKQAVFRTPARPELLVQMVGKCFGQMEEDLDLDVVGKGPSPDETFDGRREACPVAHAALHDSGLPPLVLFDPLAPRFDVHAGNPGEGSLRFYTFAAFHQSAILGHLGWAANRPVPEQIGPGLPHLLHGSV